MTRQHHEQIKPIAGQGDEVRKHNNQQGDIYNMDANDQQQDSDMTGIIGISLTSKELSARFARYIEAWGKALDAACDAVGSNRLPDVPGMARQPWEPDWPADMMPSWAVTVDTQADGPKFFVEFDGPEIDGVFLTQEIEIDLDGGRYENLTSVQFSTRGLELHAGEDDYLDLPAARVRTAAMISAGKLMVSLLEGPRDA